MRSVISDLELQELCWLLWGNSPERIAYPGGRDRKVVTVTVDGREMAVAKRASSGRAVLEATVLRQFAGNGQVPALIARHREFVVQAKAEGKRLTEALEFALPGKRTHLLRAAGSGLLALQDLARSSSLSRHAPPVGAREGWFEDLSRSLLALAGDLNLPAPDYDPEQVAALLRPKRPLFVKWDARPGNALLAPGGKTVWLDWEHCACGSAEDDLVWLLADEWAPICASAEQELIARAAETEAEPLPELSRRFHIKGVLHSAIRLHLIFRRKGEGPWWNVREAMRHDRVGVSLQHIRRLCRRARRWCEETKELRKAAAFFGEVAGYAENLSSNWVRATEKSGNCEEIKWR